MRRRRFLALGGAGVALLGGCVNRAQPESLTDVTTVSSYPHDVDGRFRVPANAYGGWRFEGAFTRSVGYRVETRSGAAVDVLALHGDAFRAFADGEHVDTLDGSTTNATEASGAVESPSSRATFYLVLDNTDRGVAAAGTDVEVAVSFDASII